MTYAAITGARRGTIDDQAARRLAYIVADSVQLRENFAAPLCAVRTTCAHHGFRAAANPVPSAGDATRRRPASQPLRMPEDVPIVGTRPGRGHQSVRLAARWAVLLVEEFLRTLEIFLCRRFVGLSAKGE